MVSGEGKTLAAIMPAYLNALTGKSVHIHTVNEYLAKRDANLMGRVFNFLGLSTGVITQGAKERLFNNSYLFNNICIRQRTAEFKFLRNSNFLVGGKPGEYVKKKEVYDADIIYGYSREIVFDYLRDVLVNKTTAQVSQKQIALTIVDEGDSILIDGNIEPLVIAVPADGNFLNYVFKEIYELSKDCVYDVDYELNYRDKTATLSRNGKSFFKKAINENKYLKDLDLDLLVVFLENAIASEGYVENVDYVVPRDRFGRKKVVVYDETSGKLKPGSIWENGLHQFIELKHNCKLTAPSTVVISICYKNYYDKLCNLAAMSGTLRPVANELKEYYGLEFLKVPKRNESLRKDLPDVITLTDATKWKLIVSDIEQKHKIGRPVYVGTRSIKEARWLKKEIGKIGIKANLFDGLDPENEEKIIMNAGEPGAVTITTQLGGRGVDVELGEEVRAKGGLYVIGVGSYRDERIKKQLQLRAGRGADPGSTRFYISLQEEDLIHFGGKDILALKKEIKEFKKKFKIDENVGIWKKILARKMQYGLEKIQKGICQYKTNIRKRAMRVDDILDDKRQFFYYMKMLNRYDGRMIQANLIKLNNIWISFLDSIWKKRNICSLYKTEYENMCYKEFQKMIKEIKNKPYLYEKEFNAKRNVNLRALLELIKQDAEKEEIGIFESEDQQLKLVNTAMGLNLTISDKNYERTVEILKKSKNKIKLHDFKNVVKNETEEVLRLNEMPENGWHEKNSSESLESGTIVEAFEECLIVSILREQNFNVKKTADVLNISTGYLIFKLLEIESRFKELPNLEIIKNETENIDVETSFIEKQLLLDVSAHDYKLNISLKGFSAEIATMTLKDCFQSIIKFMKGENPKLNLMSLKEKIGNEVMKVILCKLKEKGKDVSYMSKLAEVDKCYLEQLMKTNKLNLSNAEEEYAKESIVLFDAEIDFLDLKNRVMRGIEERVILYSLSRAKNDSKTAAEKLLMSKEEFDAKIKSIIITQCRNRARVVFEQEDFLEESFGQRAKEEYLGIIKDFEYFVDERNPKINLINVKERISNQIKCVFISKALHETKGNTEKAAKLLKISKRGLWDIIKRHNLIYPEVTQEYVKMKKFFNGEDLNKTVMEMSRKVEKWGVSQALKLSKGNRTRAAESVGIGRRQFTDWLKEIKEGIVECESELFYEKARIFLHELFEELEPYYDFHSQVASDSFFVEIDISDSESLEEEKLEESLAVLLSELPKGIRDVLGKIRQIENNENSVIDFKNTIREMENSINEVIITAALREVNGKRIKAAKLLGIDRGFLYQKLKKCNLNNLDEVKIKKNISMDIKKVVRTIIGKTKACLIRGALLNATGNKAEAADNLKLSRRHYYDYLREFSEEKKSYEKSKEPFDFCALVEEVLKWLKIDFDEKNILSLRQKMQATVNYKKKAIRKRLTVAQAYNCLCDVMKTSDIDKAFCLAQDILNYPINDIMVVGADPVAIPFLLALVGKRVTFVDSNIENIRRMQVYVEVMERRMGQSLDIEFICAKITSAESVIEQKRYDLIAFLKDKESARDVDFKKILYRAEKYLKKNAYLIFDLNYCNSELNVSNDVLWENVLRYNDKTYEGKVCGGGKHLLLKEKTEYDGYEQKRRKVEKFFFDELIIQSINAERRGENILIGIDTSWVPKIHQSMMQGLLTQLSRKFKEKSLDCGINNISIKRRFTPGKLREMIRCMAINEEAEKGEILDNKFLLKNVIALTREKNIMSGFFDEIKSSDDEKKAVLLGVKSEDLNGAISNDDMITYIGILEMLTGALKLLSCENEPETISVPGAGEFKRISHRTWSVFPKEHRLVEDVRKEYKFQGKYIKTAT